ncbi:hypothetical protein ACFPFX_34905 [Streptomyces mauvecolor]|uniref:Uncharacterized protein n=1 Tax=Streptomyces mauvecolor TaxID=58345 RepID=A0ABV9UY62_9ACTN
MLRSEEIPKELRDPDADPPPWDPSHEKARILGRGERILDVLPTLNSAPYGDEDIPVVFDHLDFTHRAIRNHVMFEDHRTMLVCFALARSQNRPLSTNDCGPAGGPTHPVRTCIRVAACCQRAGEDRPLKHPREHPRSLVNPRSAWSAARLSRGAI